MPSPTVDRFRYPYRAVVPGDLHTVIVAWATPIDLSANTYSATMVDAATGNPVAGVAYTPNMAQGNVGVLVFTAPIPANIDTTVLNEIRIKQLTPTVETLVAGHVCYPATTIAGVL